MKKIMMLVLVLIFLVGCSSSSGEYQTITPEDAHDQLASEDILLLDVRTEMEHLTGSIPGSVLYPHDTIDEDFVSIYPDKDQKIFVFCRSGNRSKTASNKLLDLGYTDVYDLGGINDWPYDVY